MTQNNNNWSKTINPPINTSIIYYKISACDQYGFWNNTQTKQITITDIMPPDITDNTQNKTTTGNIFTFNATITDNIEVSNVYVQYWENEQNPNNETMGWRVS